MPTDPFTLKSFAKINWHLRVLGKRPDAFHEICTVFQTVSLHDQIDFSEADKITLTCEDVRIPTDKRNLIIKAANLLAEKFEIKKGAKMHLSKKIPAPGGLGGGSSNAAVALLGLVRLWGIRINFEELAVLGSALGSDVPFFFQGGTALGTGRGTEILPLEDLNENHLLIVTPKVEISTAKAFDLLGAEDLTNADSKSILKICQEGVSNLHSRQKNLVNDFEKTVFEIAPEIERVKKRLLRLGAESSLMSGSGASVFAVFDGRKKLTDVCNELESETDWQKFTARTISREEYFNSLKIGEIF